MTKDNHISTIQTNTQHQTSGSSIKELAIQQHFQKHTNQETNIYNRPELTGDMTSSATNQAQQSRSGVILARDHFVEPPYDLARGEKVGRDAAAAARRQHLAERRKPDRYIPREKGSKAGRCEADMVVHEQRLLDDDFPGTYLVNALLAVETVMKKTNGGPWRLGLGQTFPSQV